MRRLPTIGEGPPLVYVPGLDGSGEMLFAHEDEVARRFRLLRVPSRTDSAFDYDDLVGDVLAAMDDENVGRATVFAESFGGSVALELALRRPDRVERLVMLNTFAWFPNRALLRWGGALARSAPAAVVHAVRVLVDMPTLALEGVPADARSRFLEITKQADGVVISAQYTTRVPLFGNASACLDFNPSSAK